MHSLDFSDFSREDREGIAQVGQVMVAVKTGRMGIAEAREMAQRLLDGPDASAVMMSQARMMLDVLARWEAQA